MLRLSCPTTNILENLIMQLRSLLLVATLTVAPTVLIAQGKSAKATPDTAKTNPFKGLKFRGIGPAFMSGRISDIAINPQKPSTWYVAVGSGGVWKTDNAGTTWAPLFDGEASFSIGCITLDPQNPQVVWVGSGENVGGRHVGYGDGIYRSEDGGKSWKNMGLKSSEHLSKIIVHPKDPNTVWVASQGPLWSKGGERGVYKTIDGGKTWKRTLGDAAWIGATSLMIDPRDPELLYAATWQRHRTVAGYMGGGPGTAIHRSTDGGETWQKLTQGLPDGNLGKIGLAISPQQPDVLYAAIELDRRSGAVYRSSDRGASWTKMSDAVAGGTGPHYYQELYASPHQFDRLYLVSNYTLTSDDGGKNFRTLKVDTRHVDDHVIAFRADDPEYLIFGTDGGLYETFDRGTTWRRVANLPVTQFYKIAVDDAMPFYNIYGGTQDNSTQEGPSRTDNVNGIRNADWELVLGGDGHQPATEPGNPAIAYAEWQQGNLMRLDRTTGESVFIRPQAGPGEPTERSNWDAPIVVSPHDPATLYFGTYRVWKSTDRGDSWIAISKDLTTHAERLQTPFFGTTQGWDNAWDISAMSAFSTITSLAVSPVKKGIIYAGTDDGLLQVTEDEGTSWRRVELKNLPGLPVTAFVNDIKADLFDPNTVLAVFDNHKTGDYKPYIFRTADMGRTWSSLAGNLPDRTLLWRVVQDHVNPLLLFLGTESGVYTSTDGGRKWAALKGGLPTIPVRDIAIQRRENDLVLGTFGRGIFILDDYSALRTFSADTLKGEAYLFHPRPAQWYTPSVPLGDAGKATQGDDLYLAPNPPFGAEFTYFLKESYPDLKKQRQKTEKGLKDAGKPLTFPGWEAVEAEARALEPKVWLFVSDSSGTLVKRVEAANGEGFQRVVWDLKASAQRPVTKDNVDKAPDGPVVAPGRYTAQLYKQLNGEFSPISDAVDVTVVPLRKGHLPGSTPAAVATYAKRIDAVQARVDALQLMTKGSTARIGFMLKAYERAPRPSPELQGDLLAMRKELESINIEINGSKARNEVGEEKRAPGVTDRLETAYAGIASLSYGPTATHLASAALAEQLAQELQGRLDKVTTALPGFEDRLKAIGAPMQDER